MSPSRSAAGTRTRRGFTRRGSATSTDGATPATEGTGTHEVGLGPRSSARTDHPADGPPSDAPLWAEAQRGSTAAFAELFDRHADAVYRYTNKTAGNDPSMCEPRDITMRRRRQPGARSV